MNGQRPSVTDTAGLPPEINLKCFVNFTRFIIPCIYENIWELLYQYRASARVISILSERVSVCHVPVRYRIGLMYRRAFLAHGSPIILIFSVLHIFAKFGQGHPLWGCRIQVEYINFVIFCEICCVAAATEGVTDVSSVVKDSLMKFMRTYANTSVPYIPLMKNYPPPVKFMLAAEAATTHVPYVSCPVKKLPLP